MRMDEAQRSKSLRLSPSRPPILGMRFIRLRNQVGDTSKSLDYDGTSTFIVSVCVCEIT